jgi:alanyl-tRNA synthetase
MGAPRSSSTPRHSIRSTLHDQPADRGTITTTAGAQPIVDAVTGGIRDGELVLGEDMRVRTGTVGWTFVVAHIIKGLPPAVGEPVQIDVPQRRGRR